MRVIERTLLQIVNQNCKDMVNQEYKIATASTAAGLQATVNGWIEEGWTPYGGHQVVEIHRQNRYSGTQHMSTQVQHEYSQALSKKLYERRG